MHGPMYIKYCKVLRTRRREPAYAEGVREQGAEDNI